MDAIQRLIAEQACAKQIARYATLLDAGEHEAVAALFAEHASYARPSDPANPIKGRAAILAEFQGRPPRLSRHVITNVIVNVESETTATASCRVTLYMGTGADIPAPVERTLVGDFYDQFEKIGDEWLFVERRGSITLRA